MTSAGRLEYVRWNTGLFTLKDFWKEISKSYKVSYEALRNYHYGDREPPAKYYAAVARRFGVSLDWLITGEHLVAGEGK